MCETHSSSHPLTSPSKKKKSTQIFPVPTEATLEAEGQRGFKGSWTAISGATRSSGWLIVAMTGTLGQKARHPYQVRTLLPMAV